MYLRLVFVYLFLDVVGLFCVLLLVVGFFVLRCLLIVSVLVGFVVRFRLFV